MISRLLNASGECFADFWSSFSVQISPLQDSVLQALDPSVSLESQLHVINSGNLLGAA